MQAFGSGQVSTYVILGMGEDPAVTVEDCKRAIDIGVYPFIVPLRPVPGAILASPCRRRGDYVESIYRQVVPHLRSRGMTSAGVMAGCARCQACSGMAVLEHGSGPGPGSPEPPTDGRRMLPLQVA